VHIYTNLYVYICIYKCIYIYVHWPTATQLRRAYIYQLHTQSHADIRIYTHMRMHMHMRTCVESRAVLLEHALVSLKLEKSVDAEGGRTFAVVIEGG